MIDDPGRTRRVYTRYQLSFYNMVIHCASTTTYLVGGRLAAFAVDHSNPLRNLEWCVTVPSLAFVVGGLSFQTDMDLVWDASLLAEIMISSGSYLYE